jgi:hypothetical protein
MGNHSNVLSEADFSVADIRRVRWLLKCLGVSPFTLAKTIELQAWRGIEPWLTPKILRAVPSEGNIAALLSTARKIPTGGTGIRSTVTGQTLAMDILGKWFDSVGGVFCHFTH